MVPNSTFHRYGTPASCKAWCRPLYAVNLRRWDTSGARGEGWDRSSRRSPAEGTAYAVLSAQSGVSLTISWSKQLEERVDFAERLLAKPHEGERLGYLRTRPARLSRVSEIGSLTTARAGSPARGRAHEQVVPLAALAAGGCPSRLLLLDRLDDGFVANILELSRFSLNRHLTDIRPLDFHPGL